MQNAELSFANKLAHLNRIVILSEAKDLLFFRSEGKQILRFAQDDNSLGARLGRELRADS